MSNAWRERILILILFAVIALVLIGPIASSTNIPNELNLLRHVAAIVQTKMAFAEGQFPLRIAPLDHSGLRYPFFQFYSPTAYLFSGLIYKYFTPLNPYSAYQLSIWFVFALGGVFFYRLAYCLVKSKPSAILAAAVYMLAPYNLMAISYFGGFSESLALGLLPVVLYYAFRCFHYPCKGLDVLWSVFFWFLLATTHLITFIYASVFIMLMFLSLVIFRYKFFRGMISLSVAYICGCLLAMWYFAPIIMVWRSLVFGHVEGSSSLRWAVPTLSDLLLPSVNVAKIVEKPSADAWITLIHPAIGLPILVAIGVLIYAVFTKQFLGSIRLRLWAGPLLFIFCVLFLVVWSPINFWGYLPESFRDIPYAWRLLGQIAWVGALIFAWAVCSVFKNKMDARHAIFGLALIVISVNAWFSIPGRHFILLKVFMDNYVVQESLQRDFLIDEKRYVSLFDKPKEIISVDVMKKNCYQQGSRTLCQVDVRKNFGLIELPVLYYPSLLEVSLNGRSVNYVGVPYKDKLIVGVAPEVGVLNRVVIRFRGISWANNVSLCAWGLWFASAIFLATRRILYKWCCK